MFQTKVVEKSTTYILCSVTFHKTRAVYETYILCSVTFHKTRAVYETYILCSVTFHKTRAVYEITWENIVQPGRPQMTYVSCESHAG